MDVALEKRQVKRAYKLYAPAYDLVFDWIFHPGREAAVRQSLAGAVPVVETAMRVPGGDAELFALSEGRDRLPCRVPYGPPESVRRVLDKASLAEAAKARLGLDLIKADMEPALREFVASLTHERASGSHTAIDVRVGEASDVILNAIDRERIDLVVMGTHGVGGELPAR